MAGRIKCVSRWKCSINFASGWAAEATEAAAAVAAIAGEAAIVVAARAALQAVFPAAEDSPAVVSAAEAIAVAAHAAGANVWREIVFEGRGPRI